MIKFRVWFEESVLKKAHMVDWEELKEFKGLSRLFDDAPHSESFSLMQSTGLKDKNGVEIFEGDIIETSWGTNYSDGYKPVSIYIGTVGFGEYEQDASGGEYGGERCIGFYGEFFVGADDDRDFSKLDSYSYEKQQSLLKFDEIEVLGNIYANPELLSNP